MFRLVSAILLIDVIVLAEKPWEWMAAFDLTEPAPHLYKWTSQKKDGAYADKDAMFSIQKEGADTAALWEKAPQEVTAGATLVPDTLYKLVFDTTSYQTTYSISIATPGHYVVAFQHFPTEFEDSVHFLKDASGTDIEGEEHEAEGEENKDHLLLALAANVISSVCSLIGVTALFLGLKKLQQVLDTIRLFSLTFAGGALLGAAFFLIAPESVMIFNGTSDGEGQAFAKFGSCLIGGVFIAALLHWLFDDNMQSASPKQTNEPATEAEAQTLSSPDVELAKPNAQPEIQSQSPKGLCGIKPVVWSILIGDGLHNAIDGIAIAIAFKSCTAATGWVVLVGTVAHEIPQELADYLVLTLKGGLKPSLALLFNFLSACTCIIAGLVASSIDTTEESQAGLLAFSAGIYAYIGVGELLSQVKVTSFKELLIASLSFLFGTTAVGLVLFEHTHCTAGGGHEGHAH